MRLPNFSSHLSYFVFSFTIIFGLISCSVRQYRVIETTWHFDSDEYAYGSNQDGVYVRPWCWGNKGRLKIAIENASDSAVYIDLFHSFFAVDSVFFLYRPDSLTAPIFYGVCNAKSTTDWSKVILDQSTTKQFLLLQPGDLVVLSKFVLYDWMEKKLNCEDDYLDSQRFNSANSPVVGAHGVGYYLGANDTLRTIDQSFYVGAVRQWTLKSPDKLYPPENRQNQFYIYNHTLHPLGTFIIFGLLSFSIHLGTVD
jgi:hypothetical protein